MKEPSQTILECMTNNIIFRMHEKESLKRLAQKITKVPDIIHIPSEYLVEKERERENI